MIPVPDSMQCQVCGYLLPTHPEFEAYIQARGFDDFKRKMATCRCAIAYRNGVAAQIVLDGENYRG